MDGTWWKWTVRDTERRDVADGVCRCCYGNPAGLPDYHCLTCRDAGYVNPLLREAP